VGKSTLFAAITNAKAEIANYPFCTIEPNVGIGVLPDERLAVLFKMYNAKKLTPATVDFVDIAGLVAGAAEGKGLGNKFLAHIREVDAIVHVVRCFVDDDIIHVNAKVCPRADIEIINTELALADLDMLERRIVKVTNAAKAEKKYLGELDRLKRLYEHVSSGQPTRNFAGNADDAAILETVPLLSDKPVIYVANLSEDDFSGGFAGNECLLQVKEIAEAEKNTVVVLSAKLERDMADLLPDEKMSFLADLGVGESGLEKLIRIGYETLGLISFFTAGPPEVRAWTIKKGTNAKAAAGKIHTDIERGFIRAEVIGYNELVACGGISQAKEKGLVRLEGKDYIMQDGDVVFFRFNV
jgi:GTP-binding protein YchF